MTTTPLPAGLVAQLQPSRPPAPRRNKRAGTINALALHAGLIPVPPRPAAAPVRRCAPADAPTRPLVSVAVAEAAVRFGASQRAQADEETITRALDSAAHPLFRGEIAHALGMDPDRVSFILYRLRAKGIAQSTGAGKGCLWRRAGKHTEAA